VYVDDRGIPCCFPLVSQPVRIHSGGFRRMTLRPAGPPELTPLVADPDVAARLEADATYGGGALGPTSGNGQPTAALINRLPRLQAWVRAVVDAVGLPPVHGVLPPSEDPIARRRSDGLVAVVGAVLYAAQDVFRPSAEAALRLWATRSGLENTAFAHVYGATAPPTGTVADPRTAHAATTGAATESEAAEPVCSPLPLSQSQAAAVERSRREAVTVISGPPGSGKSHTVAAIAADAVSRGESVLIATRSEHAATVVADLLTRQTGPDPVQFGAAQSDEIARQAAARGVTNRDVDAARQALAAGRARQAIATRAVTRQLEREAQAARAPTWDGLVGELTAIAPGGFAGDADLDALRRLATEVESRRDGSWWRRWWARRTERRYRSALGAAPHTPLAELATALRCATDRRAAAELAASGGTVLTAAWSQLLQADEEVRQAAGRVAEVEAASEQRRREGRRAAADLATALRAGRRARRRLLHDLDAAAVVMALPLWVGTLQDATDLLPETPGLFDLVLLDEASQIDQLAAAGGLLRATRAVVVGDPAQLRHVSFVSDDQITTSLREHRLHALAARLDVRRASVLDVAAGTAPMTWLDEHYRSVPHLIEFSARRFYDGRLTVATRHPDNEASDAIQIVRVPDGESELDAGLAELARLADRGQRDIAFVTPFRDLADAAQAALLARYDLEDVERLRLRVGTVHGFQGAEAGCVVLVLGVAANGPPGRRRFVENPHLFNVMVTRAKRSLIVVTALPVPDGSSPPAARAGLIDQYLAHADRPPAPPRDGPAPSPWAAALADELARAGTVVRTGYPVGRWTVDLCVGAEAAAAVETGVHRDGPAAHIARHRMLAAAGWRILDGYPTRWDGDATRAAIELAAEAAQHATTAPVS
jgi:hypothetical protein